MHQKKQWFLVFLLLLGVNLPLLAQPNAKRNCDAEKVHKQLYQSDPAYKKRRDEIEERIRRINAKKGIPVGTIQQVPGNRPPQRTRTANRTMTAARALSPTATQIVTIPVIIHVLYNNAGDSIGMAQINAQIDTLNKDFRKLNADTSKIPLVFKELAADCQLQFCLAKYDEKGDSINGVIYKYTAKPYFTSNNDAKFNATGGDNAWDCNRYLNIWVCDLMGTMGYSSFPGSPANLDGIVVHNTVFGSGGTTSQPYNMGRTLTHEIGHWLNLFHIWGDDNNTCVGTDNVYDTPNQDGPNYYCPTFPVTSGCASPNGDMFMNFMDYCDDACLVMFTKGQKERMDASFTCGGPRWEILRSTACSGVGYDTVTGAGTSNICSSNATIYWNASPQALNYVVEYKEESSALWIDTTVNGTSLILSGLNPSARYQYRITCQCMYGNSQATTVNTFQTKALCMIPSSFAASGLTHLSGQATWSAVSSASNYNVRYRRLGDAAWITQNTSSTNINFNGLTPLTIYEVQIQSNCDCEISLFSATDTFITAPPPCIAPSANTPAPVGCNSASISWGTVPYAASYTYRYKQTDVASWITVPTTGTAVTLNGLLPATNYEIQLQSNCGGTNNSTWSASTNFTTTAPSCTDSYEPNNKVNTPFTLVAPNNCFGATIDKASDRDFYRITTTASQPNLKITLSNLPANYDLQLFLLPNTTTPIKKSINTGNLNELIINNATTEGTYIIGVIPGGPGQSSLNCYHLSITTSSTNW